MHIDTRKPTKQSAASYIPPRREPSSRKDHHHHNDDDDDDEAQRDVEGEAQEESAPPFNHYKRHTRLKRQLFAWRREAFLRQWSYGMRQLAPSQQQEEQPPHISDDNAPPLSNDAEGEVVVGGASSEPAAVPSVDPSMEAARHLVVEMEQVYLRMDDAMRHQRYQEAHRLKSALRWRRRRLVDVLRHRRAGPSATLGPHQPSNSEQPALLHDEANAGVELSLTPPVERPPPPSQAPPSTSRPFCSFFPDSMLLFRAAASLSSSSSGSHADRRSFDRYPVLLDLSMVEQLPSRVQGKLEERIECHAPEPSEEDKKEAGSSRARLAAQSRAALWDQWLDEATRTTSCPPHSKDHNKKKNSQTRQQGQGPPPASQQLPSVQKKPHPVPIHAQVRNLITVGLDDLAFTTLHFLFEEQKTLRQKQPLLYKARQRYVVGFHEVLKWLRAGRLQLVLLASDLELEGRSDGGDMTEADDATTKNNNHNMVAPPSPPEGSADAAASASQARHTTTTTSHNNNNKAGAGKKTTFRSIAEAVQLIQSSCRSESSAFSEAEKPQGDQENASTVDVPSSSGDVKKALCISCLSRHTMAYALVCKGRSQVGCVGIAHAEKHHFLVKALRSYGEVLQDLYPSLSST